MKAAFRLPTLPGRLLKSEAHPPAAPAAGHPGTQQIAAAVVIIQDYPIISFLSGMKKYIDILLPREKTNISYRVIELSDVKEFELTLNCRYY